MRTLIASTVIVAALPTPAFAEDKSTLDHVVAHGVVLSTQGMDIPVTDNEDGTYTAEAMGMTIDGSWRIDGTSLCTESSMQPGENCTEYPEGKGPGDTFEVNGAMGPATITINE